MVYPAFLGALATARTVVTDSGGVIEGAANLGTPCAIARDKTERPESCEAGAAMLGGRTADTVATALEWAIHANIQPTPVYGDGNASRRILQVLQNARLGPPSR